MEVTIPPVNELIKDRIYKIDSRNLGYGKWDGQGAFHGIREKFGSRYLAAELHYHVSEAHGTVTAASDTGIDHTGTDVELFYLLDSIADAERWKDPLLRSVHEAYARVIDQYAPQEFDDEGEYVFDVSMDDIINNVVSAAPASDIHRAVRSLTGRFYGWRFDQSIITFRIPRLRGRRI